LKRLAVIAGLAVVTLVPFRSSATVKNIHIVNGSGRTCSYPTIKAWAGADRSSTFLGDVIPSGSGWAAGASLDVQVHDFWGSVGGPGGGAGNFTDTSGQGGGGCNYWWNGPFSEGQTLTFPGCGWAVPYETNFVNTLCITNRTGVPQNYRLYSTTDPSQMNRNAIAMGTGGTLYTNIWLAPGNGAPGSWWCMPPWTNDVPSRVHGLGSDEEYYSSNEDEYGVLSGNQANPPTQVGGDPGSTPDPTTNYFPNPTPTNSPGIAGKTDAQVIRDGFNALLNQNAANNATNMVLLREVVGNLRNISFSSSNIMNVTVTNGSGSGTNIDYRPWLNGLLTNTAGTRDAIGSLSTNLFGTNYTALGTNIGLGWSVVGDGSNALAGVMEDKWELPSVSSQSPTLTAPISVLNSVGLPGTTFTDVTISFEEHPWLVTIVTLIRNFLLVMMTWCFFMAAMSIVSKTLTGVDLSKG